MKDTRQILGVSNMGSESAEKNAGDLIFKAEKFERVRDTVRRTTATQRRDSTAGVDLPGKRRLYGHSQPHHQLVERTTGKSQRS